MRYLKLAGALALVLAFSVIGVATASAEGVLWKWLPGTKGETFTGDLDKGTAVLQVDGGSAIECKAVDFLLPGSELTGPEAKDSTLMLTTPHFTGCKLEGKEVHSEGDEPEVILSHIEIHNCLIEWLKKAKQDGVLILPLELKIFSGAVLRVTILDKEGNGFLAPIKKIGVSQYLIDAKQTGGLQEVKLCEGGKEDSLLVLAAGVEKELEAAELAEVLIKFDKTFDKEEVLS
jgi:hypothetical protein